jgi:hypothetical protein
MPARWIIILFIASFGIAGSCKNADLKSNEYRLDNVQTIKVLNESRVMFPDSGLSIIIDYETNISLDKRVELQSEARSVWQLFSGKPEFSDAKTAIVRAIQAGQTERGYGFLFVRNPNGGWMIKDGN